jgi:tetratricopeptide (TPR) repeat protein/transcriptional regulator with XRE-family HTH domain
MTERPGGRDSLGSWLRQHRKAAGLTQEELAERSGLSIRTISNLEHDRTQKPYPQSVRRMMVALGLAETASDELIARYRAGQGAESGLPRQPGRDTAGSPPAAPDLDQVLTGPALGLIPRQLPLAARHFVGRAAELESLTRVLDQATGAPGALVMSAIAGTAGVGKTALAVHWAHQVADRFPDGQLYVNLRGFDPSGQPVAPGDALAGFLRALGVPGPRIPAGADERAAQYRTLLAGRRMLVVLDNAMSVEQARPLLPGAAGCVVVVTSRDAQAGLVARDGAERLDLDLLPVADAIGLLREFIGVRVDADPQAAAVLAAQCARLPLALRVAAELAAARPAVSLAGLAGELTDQRRRLDLLGAGGDSRTAVRAVFSWSYQHLDLRTARGFRLAGLHPGPDFDCCAVAALAGLTAGQASDLLDALARACLIHATGPGRYSMHDLLRGYARELVACHDGEAEEQAALTRLFDYHLRGSATAIGSLFPAAGGRQACRPAPATEPLAADPAGALGWLDAERACLTAAVAYTAENGWPGHTTRLAATLRQHLENGGHFPEAIIIHHHAQRAAHLTGDRGAEANALDNLGRIAWLQGRHQQAVDHLQQALAFFRESGDLNGQARAQVNLGITGGRQGQFEEAAGRFREALTLFRETEDRSGQARALNNLALIDLIQGRYQGARTHLQGALALEREAGDRSSELISLNNLALAEVRRGHYQRARSHLERALALCLETGDRLSQAHVLATLGEADLRQHRYRQALDNCQQSLRLCGEIGDRYSQVTALNGIGEALLATSRPAEAREQHAAALCVAEQIGNRYGQANAHNGLARSYHASGDPRQARSHWQQALLLYRSLGAPEADQVRAQLADPASAAGRPRTDRVAASLRARYAAATVPPGTPGAT